MKRILNNTDSLNHETKLYFFSAKADNNKIFSFQVARFVGRLNTKVVQSDLPDVEAPGKVRFKIKYFLVASYTLYLAGEFSAKV